MLLRKKLTPYSWRQFIPKMSQQPKTLYGVSAQLIVLLKNITILV